MFTSGTIPSTTHPGHLQLQPASSRLNLTIGTIDSIDWTAECSVKSGRLQVFNGIKKCCCNATAQCNVRFTLDDVYTFDTGFKDFLFQRIFGDFAGGQEFKIHNEWSESVSVAVLLCP